uniref:Uncharacterized protein n=1 Tax=Moorena producens (strain JHB) TaxID=1454205 RepID=A0A1D9FWB0_MOOP1
MGSVIQKTIALPLGVMWVVLKNSGLTQSPLNPPILGDFDIIPPQNWGVRGAKPSKLRKS